MKGDYGNNPGGQHYTFRRGEWNTIRLTVTMQSSVTKSDGRIEVWCNDIKKIDTGNLRFVKVDSGRMISRLAFESFPGGGGTTPIYDNFIYVDDVKWTQGRDFKILPLMQSF